MGFDTIYAVLPDQVAEISRLQYLLAEARLPVVSVIGKYNHGKSSLLNALVEHEQFAVSDARETTVLSYFEHEGVRWLDTPGLDADVAGEDDREAMNGAWQQSDIRLFVHCVREGEFDQSESEMIDALQRDASDSGRQTLIVLTQIEQVEEQALANVQASIRKQAPTLSIIPVSAHRYLQGLQSGSALKVKKSGVKALRQALQTALDDVSQTRLDEVSALGETLGGLIDQGLSNLQAQLEHRQSTQQAQLTGFMDDYRQLHSKLHQQLKGA
jgi:GTPase